jgi:hypothetical protein
MIPLLFNNVRSFLLDFFFNVPLSDVILLVSETTSRFLFGELLDSFIQNNLYYIGHQDLLVATLHHSPELTSALSWFSDSYILNVFSVILEYDTLSGSILLSLVDKFVKCMLIFLALIMAFVFLNGEVYIAPIFSLLGPIIARFESYSFV